MDKIQQLQDDIKKWSDEAFGMHRTGKPIAYHLKKEIGELIDILNDYHQGTYMNKDLNPDELIDILNDYHVGVHMNEDLDATHNIITAKRWRIKMEAADCFTLLLDILAHEQFDVNDLIEASFEKLEINKKRKWGKPDENGVIEHIEE